MKKFISDYLENLNQNLSDKNIEQIDEFCEIVEHSIKNKNNIYICGNGGSAANSIHMATDLNLVLIKKKYNLFIDSLASNQGIISCIANDFGYEKIFSEQIKLRGKKNDLLISLSGSGNSKNIINAINIANDIEMNTYSILGFDGGEAKKISKKFFHLEINDMQLSEDAQHIINHICAKYLNEKL
jgi:D-sedoheptulose 7-phosphate isomerase